jgi:GxxExxY protein
MQPTLLQAERVDSIVATFHCVYNYFGCGLSEKIYMRSLALELEERGHRVMTELSLPVFYKSRQVSLQRIDRVVDDRIILEGKATERIAPADRAQLISYLKAPKRPRGEPKRMISGGATPLAE